MMVIEDTESSDSENLMYDITPGQPLVIAFTGMARGLNELANFEFVKVTKDIVCSKIFCRDPHFVFYHRGVDDRINNILRLRMRLEELVEEARPSKIICVGVSAGGYAALLFGHFLIADQVHAFGPQTFLFKEWGVENEDSTIENCKIHNLDLHPLDDYRDLKIPLSQYNGKTFYNIHIGNCRQDILHADNVGGCFGIKVKRYQCGSHACASQILKSQGKLGAVIMEGVF